MADHLDEVWGASAVKVWGLKAVWGELTQLIGDETGWR
jgi:hypothetical protein